MVHDLSEFSSSTIIDRIFDIWNDETGAALCGCLPGVELCELDDEEALFDELDKRNYGKDHIGPGAGGSRPENGIGAEPSGA